MSRFSEWREDAGTGLNLVINDLLHDWKLSSCLVLSIAAVVAPLLILFGLKFGTITTLENRLLNDPKNLEIVPRTTLNHPQVWFDQLAARPEVAFVIPSTRQISATLNARVANGKSGAASARLDIVPTAAGDLLLQRNQASIPAKGECVLTRLAAEALKASEGDTLHCTVGRSKSGSYEKAMFNLRVINVLPDRAGAKKALFARLELLQAVEAFRDGRAVPDYGWPGDLPIVYPLYHGFVLLFKSALTEIQQAELTVGTGLSRIQKLTPETSADTIGFTLPKEIHAYLLQVIHTPVGQESFQALQEKLRGMDCLLLPYVRPMALTLVDASGNSHALTAQGYWAEAEQAERLRLPALPKFPQDAPAGKALLKIILPPEHEALDNRGPCKLVIKNGAQTLSFPVYTVSTAAGLTRAMLPGQLAGILNVFFQRGVSYDPQEMTFLLGRMSFADFRLYAASLDDVVYLRSFFQNQGIEVKTMAGEIERVKALARGLSRMFWLVAVVGTIGCLAALMASFASSVERKRKELGVMRLMGISGWFIFFIPVMQAIFLALAGFLAAAAAFYAISLVINNVFSQDMMDGAKMCFLHGSHLVLALSATFFIAVLSALFASKLAIKIDPSEALRDE